MKLDRLISILVVLLRKDRVTAKHLAKMFGVSTRTILRDVDAINLAGIPIVTYQGTNGGIGIAEGYRLDRSVLTGDEMATIITALKSINTTLPHQKHQVLMEKFKNSLNASQLTSINLKTSQLIIDMSPWGSEHPMNQKVESFRNAVENCQETTFIYTDSSGKKTKRHVQPHTLVLKGQKWYLYAWCTKREDFRLFKLSRMKDIQVMDIVFIRREVNLDTIPWDTLWHQPGNTIQLELVFDTEMESVVLEIFGEEALEHCFGKILVKASFPENNWLYGFLLSFGPTVEVIKPPHLRSILADIAHKIQKKYSSNTT